MRIFLLLRDRLLGRLAGGHYHPHGAGSRQLLCKILRLFHGRRAVAPRNRFSVAI
jgi:hypothetical protein